MPDTLMDYIVIIGVLAGVAAAIFAYRQLKGAPRKTSNTIIQGNRNQQEGGPGPTENRIEGGDSNSQKG